MSVTTLYIEEYRMILYRIECADTATIKGLTRVLDDLDTALDRLISDLDDDTGEFVSFEFLKPGQSLKQSREFDPWNSFSRSFWNSVHSHPDLHSRIVAWIDRLASVIDKSRSIDGNFIWEDDQTAFGEPLVSQMALLDRAFIPAYTKLFARWDTDHEVYQRDTIQAIFRRHGISEQTEDLLLCRAAINPGQHGHHQLNDLLPVLQKHYGEFTQSPLFRRIVSRLHAEDAKLRTKTLTERRYRLMNTRNSVLDDGAEAICRELNAITT